MPAIGGMVRRGFELLKSQARQERDRQRRSGEDEEEKENEPDEVDRRGAADVPEDDDGADCCSDQIDGARGIGAEEVSEADDGQENVPDNVGTKAKPVRRRTTKRKEYSEVRQKAAAKLPPSLAASRDRAFAAGVRTNMPRMGKLRFKTFIDFQDYLAQYFMENHAGYRIRHSRSAVAKNVKSREQYKEDRAAAKAAGTEFSDLYYPIPEDLQNFETSYWCVHGCTQAARPKTKGEPMRVKCSTRFTGCTARVTGEAKRDWATGDWYIVLKNELTEHNHKLSPAVFATYYDSSSELYDADLYGVAALAFELGAEPKKVQEKFSVRLGYTFTRRMYDNLKNYRMGGRSALSNLQGLLDLFRGFDGYRGLVFDDQGGDLTGLVLQSAIQRSMFQRWGDTLILDWTHNTNNLGFYLGSLMVTSANGKGVSVLDFLCNAQSHVMMEAVFSFFLENNPGAREKIESIVIDKDYTEWKVLHQMFPESTIVLCIFHVLKWFKYVVTVRKYKLDGIKDDVLKYLRAMVYSRSQDEFDLNRAILSGILSADEHEEFREYMIDCWYNCTDMWSYARRGYVFTATNSTSNRLESFWNQFKQSLGKNRRIDSCVENIFRHGTSVLRREEGLLKDFDASKTFVHDDCDAYLRPVLAELCQSAAKLVKSQWTSFVAGRSKYSRVADDNRGGIVVRVRSARSVDFSVNTTSWTCSCQFHMSSRLPCRHLFYVARAMGPYPVVSIASRWKLSDAVKMARPMRAAIKEYETLRIAQLKEDPPDPEVSGSPKKKPTHLRTFGRVTLRRREVSKFVVMNDIEKRNVVHGQMERLVTFMVAQGTPGFKVCVEELEDVLTPLLQRWAARDVPAVAVDADLDGTVNDQRSVSPSSNGCEGEAPDRDDAPSPSPPAEAPPRERHDPLSPAEYEDWRAFLLGDIDDEQDPDEEDVAPVYDASRDHALNLGIFADHSDGAFGGQHSLLVDDDIASVPGMVRFPSELGSPISIVGEMTALMACTVDSQVPPGRVGHALRGAVAPLSKRYHVSRLEDLLLDDDDAGHAEPGIADATTVYCLGLSNSRPETQTQPTQRGDGSDIVQSLRRDVPVARTVGSTVSSPARKARVGAASSVASSPASNTRGAKRRAGDASLDTVEKSKRIAGTVHDGAEPTRVQDCGVIASITLPGVRRRGVTKTSKQASKDASRVMYVQETSDCPVDLPDFILLLRAGHLVETNQLATEYPVLFKEKNLTDRNVTVSAHDTLRAGLFRFSFVIPSQLVKKLLAAILNKRVQDGNDRAGDPDGEQGKVEYVCRIASLREFDERTLLLMQQFYDIRASLQAYDYDVKWVTLPSEDWVGPVNTQVPFLQDEADDVEGKSQTVCSDVMRTKIGEAWARCSLSTYLVAPAPGGGVAPTLKSPTRIPLENVLGHLAMRARLDDCVLNFSLQMLASQFTDVVVVDSLISKDKEMLTEGTRYSVPPGRLNDTRLVLFPLHFSKNHWCIIMIAMTSGSPPTSYMYDPLVGKKCSSFMATATEKWCIPFLTAWKERDDSCAAIVDVTGEHPVTEAAPTSSLFTMVQMVPVTSPRQASSDATNCGIFCIVQAYAYMHDDFAIQDADILTPFQIRLIRVRLLWLLLCRSTRQDADEDVNDQVQSIAATFQRYTARPKKISSQSGKKAASSKTVPK